jgi:dUTP pyrophosphatase
MQLKWLSTPSPGVKLKRKIEITKVNENAVVPSYQTISAAGFDFHSVVSELIMPGETKLIGTGLAFAVPEGLELQVRPRSGISAKTGIRVANAPGTVDADFRGEVKIILTNTGNLPYTVNVGDRVAQGVICPVYQAEFCIVDSLESTERGDKGFGSTGV